MYYCDIDHHNRPLHHHRQIPTCLPFFILLGNVFAPNCTINLSRKEVGTWVLKRELRRLSNQIYDGFCIINNIKWNKILIAVGRCQGTRENYRTLRLRLSRYKMYTWFNYMAGHLPGTKKDTETFALDKVWKFIKSYNEIWIKFTAFEHISVTLFFGYHL